MPAGTPSLLYVVKQLELSTRAHLDALLRDAGVTALQYTALTVLERRSGMTSADLARHSFVRAQSAADLVAGLERRGLIRRDPDPANRRRRLISLTESGRELLREQAEQVAELEAWMVRDLDEAQREAFAEALASCRAAMRLRPLDAD
ncbi:MarR family transcriptional regulator [Arsenicicoccus sp. oral taxon 190]|nr:MarR family transcriptional regulator [Arsenicicoccus sp. oral taxon 190]